MPSLPIVEHLDPLEAGESRASPRRLALAVDQLRLERPEEALGEGIDAPMLCQATSGLGTS